MNIQFGEVTFDKQSTVAVSAKLIEACLARTKSKLLNPLFICCNLLFNFWQILLGSSAAVIDSTRLTQKYVLIINKIYNIN